MLIYLRVLLLLILSVGLISTGIAQQDVPTPSQVQRSLDSLSQRNLSEAETQTLKLTLQQTLHLLEKRDDYQQELTELKHTLQDAPRQIAAAQQELAKLKSTEPADLGKRYANWRVAQLTQMQTERNTQLMLSQKSLGEANSLTLNAQTRPEKAQAEISQNQARSKEIIGKLKSAKDNGKSLTPEMRQQFNAELAMLEVYDELLRQELQGNNLLMDLGNAQRELLMFKIMRIEQENLALQSLINDKRRAESEQTVAELAKDSAQASTDSLLSKQNEENLALSNQLLHVTDRLNDVTRQNLQSRLQLDNLNQSSQALQEQINVLKGSVLLSKILLHQKQSLPNIEMYRAMTDEIADIRLTQFELNQKREALGNPEQVVNDLMTQHNANPEIKQALLEIIKQRSELQERLNRDLNALLNECITLQLNQEQLRTMSDSLRLTLDEQLFWIPSHRPLDFAWFSQMPAGVVSQFAAMPWAETGKQFLNGMIANFWLFIPLLLLFGGLLFKRQYLKDKLDALDKDIDHLATDSQLHTPLALLLNILLALPFSLFLLLGGVALRLHAEGQNANLGMAFTEMALAWLVLYTCYRLLKPGGVAERHFRWSSDVTRFLFTQIRRMGLLVLPLIAIVTIAEHQPESLGNDYIGLSFVLVGYALLAALLLRLLLSSTARKNVSALRLMLGVAITLVPVGLIVAIWLGYYYTALKLTDRLIETLYLLILWTLVEASLMRGLEVAARRLSLQREVSRELSGPKDGGETGELIEPPRLDIQKINQQTLRVMRLTLWGAFGVALYLVWADLITVFTYLNHITLYEFSSGSGDAATMVPMSLGDLLRAIVIIVLTIALTTNLPGLLEVLVLSRLSLAQGSAYAITTLLSYAIFGVGLVSTLSILGLSWDKLQWLVAALSVGIGFGMQEIFANFISGLILLFERPVRIGDIVTIDNLTGMVSRIRIRATTIVDADRKEIIVPNKTFITSTLVNWSLTDTITRVTLRVGVAYGSDLALVKQLLLKAAQENPRVLKEPEPQVFFLNFGESTLDHELRVHVRELIDRTFALDEMNRFIEREFKENGIEIAFRQVEICLKNAHGQELNISQMVPAPASVTSAPATNQP